MNGFQNKQYTENQLSKVSVIVPIYGVEKYIEHCAVSLMEQTLDGVEYIFVDDATPDMSMDVLSNVLQRYPARSGSVRIARHETNKGLPAARNTGLALASGEYVFHCDSDDYIEPEMLEKMYVATKENDADFVWCDWYLTFGHKERYMKEPHFTEPTGYLKAMLAGSAKYNVWNKLVRKRIYNEYSVMFPEGHSMGEDMTMICLAACSSKVVHVPGPLYHYVKRDGEAFTNSLSPSKLSDIKYNVNNTVTFLERKFKDRLSEDIAFFKLSTKYPFLISADPEMYRLWNEWYPEANDYIWKNPQASFRRKILETAAGRRMYIVLKLYYRMVYSFIYGVIYR